MSEHVHPNYVKIWAILVMLLVISIVGPELGYPVLTVILVFGVAVVKALTVAAYYMHLNIEKRYIWYLLLTLLALMFVLFAGVAPDVLKHQGQNWKQIAPPKPVTGVRSPVTGTGRGGWGVAYTAERIPITVAVSSGR